MKSELRIFTDEKVLTRMRSAESKAKDVTHRLIMNPLENGKYTVCLESYCPEGPVNGELFISAEVFQTKGVEV